LVTALAAPSGRMAFQVDGNTVTVLQIDDQRIEVVGNGGEPRGLALCKSEDDVRALLRGDLDAIVAALQGRLTLGGDVLFGIRVMRALRAAPLANQAGG
jgi:hypothetical protein